MLHRVETARERTRSRTMWMILYQILLSLICFGTSVGHPGGGVRADDLKPDEDREQHRTGECPSLLR